MTAPQSSILKQRVPLGKTEDGMLVLISLEWLAILRALEQQIQTNSSGSTFDPTELIALIETNAMHITELQAQMVAVQQRLDALEGGFER